MDDFFARFQALHQEYLNKFKRKLDNARQPEKDDYWKGWNAGLEWAERIIDGDKSAD
jgi:hypothetical protein